MVQIGTEQVNDADTTAREGSGVSRDKAVIFLVATAEVDKLLNEEKKSKGKDSLLDQLEQKLPNFTKVKMFYGFEKTEAPKMAAVIGAFATVHPDSKRERNVIAGAEARAAELMRLNGESAEEQDGGDAAGASGAHLLTQVRLSTVSLTHSLTRLFVTVCS